MGLDIYLKRCDDWVDAQERERKYEEGTEAFWNRQPNKKYEDYTETEKEANRQEAKALADTLGLDEGGSAPTIEYIKLPSPTDPEHYCKIGYLRSSYNESGFNRITKNLLGLDGFYHIFQPGDEEDLFIPDWQAATRRATTIAQALQAKIDSGEAFRVFKTSMNPFSSLHEYAKVCDEQKALALFMEQHNAHKGRPKDSFYGGSYSNISGEFFLKEPLQVMALIHGVEKDIVGSLKGRDNLLPCTYVVMKDNGLDWYVKAAQIAAETCNYVLNHQQPETFRLAWSG